MKYNDYQIAMLEKAKEVGMQKPAQEEMLAMLPTEQVQKRMVERIKQKNPETPSSLLASAQLIELGRI